MLTPLPATFPATRRGLHALACYVIGPARKARTGRIGLRATPGGFGTPPLPDGGRIVVRGDRLVREPGAAVRITTLRAAAEALDVDLSPDPGVGADLPPFEPDTELQIDAPASLALGAWYDLGDRLLAAAASAVTAPVSEAQLWPEHFDLAVTAGAEPGALVNVGASPGDAFEDDPYVYVGPHDLLSVDGVFWNAPFGACLPFRDLAGERDPLAAALDFVRTGLAHAGIT